MARKDAVTQFGKSIGRVVVSAASIIAVGMVALLVGYGRFSRFVRRDVDALLAQSRPDADALVTAGMLADLPAPVQRYLTCTGVIGTPLVRTARIQQRGMMHLAPDQPWIPLDAEQYYTVQPPGFVWDGTVHAGPLPLARGRDRYLGGKGNMLIKAGALVTVVDDTGEEMDQGALLRYLSEMIWFPAAFLGDNVSFAPVDDTTARVTLTDRDRSVTGTMHFDAEGRLTEFVAERYRIVNGGYELTTWVTPVTEYGERAGLRLPVRAKAVWRLPEGDLEYIDITITGVQYNVAGRDAANEEANDEDTRCVR